MNTLYDLVCTFIGKKQNQPYFKNSFKYYPLHIQSFSNAGGSFMPTVSSILTASVFSRKNAVVIPVLLFLHCLSYTLIMYTFNSTILKQGGGEISMRLKISQRHL